VARALSLFLLVVTLDDVDMSSDAPSGVSSATEQKRCFELLRKWGYAQNEVSGEGPMPDRIVVPDKIVKVVARLVVVHVCVYVLFVAFSVS
jgi:hypothetical protein